MPTLREEIKPLTGNRRRFFLLRVTGMAPEQARQIVGVTRGTHNTWLQNETFVELHRRIDEFTRDYRIEAIQLLRRDNQLEAVLLEGKIVQKMKEEIDSGDYNLIRSNLAREVYAKLITDLDFVPQVQNLTWEQRLQQIFIRPGEEQMQLEQSSSDVVEGEIVDEGN
uniref:Uncharacterized protein n=1 Tax=viral metagenome TaxID=1070528 RepID=A0A6M3IE12_9ZZZZ